jgi:hypothetical protein
MSSMCLCGEKIIRKAKIPHLFKPALLSVPSPRFVPQLAGFTLHSGL